ncbi:MAG: lysophospholipid acyltransferase family protein [Desulfatibacillaceae bacterium]
MTLVPERIEDFRPPPASLVWLATAHLRAYFGPEFYGLEDIDPSRAYLLVGNHTIYGVVDVPVYFAAIYRETGIYARGLGHHLHFKVPLWRDVLRLCGGVHGTRENCRRLMRSGQSIMVFPGGGYEVCRKKGEENRLIWKNRMGFVKLAADFGYPILPFASLGVDDAYDILLDGRDFARSPMGRVVNRVPRLNSLWKGGEEMPPIALSLGPTPFPRPARLYFSVGRPVETMAFAGQGDDPAAMRRLRDQVEDSIMNQLDRLRHIRSMRDDSGLVRRLLNRL